MSTTTDLIKTLQQYAPDTVYRFIGEAIVFDTPDGTPAIPLLMWLQPGETFEVGDRVRKPGYHDTGTVTAYRLGLVCVEWDSSGDSYERVANLGRATSAVIR
jgi:hypothetical protein